jgi:hypothetical protein
VFEIVLEEGVDVAAVELQNETAPSYLARCDMATALASNLPLTQEIEALRPRQARLETYPLLLLFVCGSSVSATYKGTYLMLFIILYYFKCRLLLLELTNSVPNI